jgi:hypothetical protein
LPGSVSGRSHTNGFKAMLEMYRPRIRTGIAS